MIRKSIMAINIPADNAHPPCHSYQAHKTPIQIKKKIIILIKKNIKKIVTDQFEVQKRIIASAIISVIELPQPSQSDLCYRPVGLRYWYLRPKVL